MTEPNYRRKIKEIELEPTNETELNADHILEVDMYYTKAGQSYYDHSRYEAGYYLSLRAVNVKHENGFQVKSFMLFGTGIRYFISPAARFSRKFLENFNDQKFIDEKVQNYLASKGLYIKGTKPIESENIQPELAEVEENA